MMPCFGRSRSGRVTGRNDTRFSRRSDVRLGRFAFEFPSQFDNVNVDVRV
jgi:hypothetical protein